MSGRFVAILSSAVSALRTLGILAATLLAPVAGCGGPSGPARYDVSGQVTYGGQPVPAGRVIFEPDQGNAGPAAYASIKNGHYATESGKGTMGGPQVVRITGSDGVAQGELAEGKPIFSEYRTTIDLPKQSTSHDFAVPGTHK